MFLFDFSCYSIIIIILFTVFFLGISNIDKNMTFHVEVNLFF